MGLFYALSEGLFLSEVAKAAAQARIHASMGKSALQTEKDWVTDIISVTHYNNITSSLSKTSFSSFLPAPFNVAAAVTQFIVTNPIVIKIRQDIIHRRFCDIVERFLRQKCLV